MADINSITNAASYRGDGNLGGFVDDSINIDIKPLQTLAAYTVGYNKVEYDQRQKDAELRARELAKIAALDFSTLDPKWRGVVDEKFKAFNDFVRKDPNVFNYRDNPKGYLEYNRRFQELKQAANNGKANTIIVEKRKNDIAATTDVAQKGLMESDLKSDIEKTDINSYMPVEQKYNLEFKDIPTPKNTQFDVLYELPNGVVTKTNTITDMGDLSRKATAFSLDITLQPLDVNSPSFLSATAEQQERLKAQESRRALSTSGYKKMGQILNDVLNSDAYKTDGKFDMNKVMADSKASPYGQLIVDYNQYAGKQKEAIKSGAYTDKNGAIQTFKNNNLLDENDYAPIDVSDGISDLEVIKILMLGKSAAQKEETKYQQTDNALQAQQNATARELGLGKLALDRDEFNLKKKQFEQTQIGTQTQINGATERAKRIFADLNSLADENGFINPDKLRKLNVEQLKYLGVEKPEERDSEGKIMAAAGFTPLDIKGDGSRKYGIQLDKQGNIQVMAVAETKDASGKTVFNRTPSGAYVGEFIPQKSTNIWNVSTNILNEELKTAGAKELNAYMGVDVTGNTTNFTDTQTKATTNGSAGQSQKSAGQPKTVVQNGYTYTWNAATGNYE